MAPVHYAYFIGSDAVLQMLIAAKADVNIPDKV